MQFISHRGFWLKPEEQNTGIAFTRALKAGFGIETDLRDHQGNIVISHDMPREGVMTFDYFLQMYTHHPLHGKMIMAGLHTHFHV